MADQKSDLQALIDSVDRTVAQAPCESRGPAKQANTGAAAVVVFATLALVAVLFARQEALFDPKPDPQLEWAGRESARRDAVGRVFAAWDSTGRLPRALTEVGPPQPLLGYTPGDTSFQLTFERQQGGRVRLVYTRGNRDGAESGR
jgi:hypothetical protein